MGDLSLVRYHGYSKLPQAQALLAQLQQEEGESLSHGIHLIAVQSADGSLVVGDSHHYGAAVAPFAMDEVDELMLRHMYEALHLGDYLVTERWVASTLQPPIPIASSKPRTKPPRCRGHQRHRGQHRLWCGA